MSLSVAYLLYDSGIAIGGVKGASAHVHKLTEALVAQGADVTIYATSIVGEAPRGVRVEEIRIAGITKGAQGDARRMQGAKIFEEEVSERLRGKRIDLIYERLSLFFDGGDRIARQVSAPRLLEINAPVTSERIKHFELFYKDEAFEAEAAAIYGARVVAVSAPLARYALQNGAIEATLLPNGADLEALSNPDLFEVEAIRSKFSLHGHFVLGFVGSLKPWHGVDIALASAALAARELPLKVLVVGDGPMRTALEAMAESVKDAVEVSFVGAVPMSEVRNYLSVMDVTVAPFLAQEEFYFSPLKVIESMAAGVPVIASNHESIKEMVEDAALLVAPGDIGALRDAIVALAENPARVVEMSRLGIELANKRSWAAIADEIISRVSEGVAQR